MEKPYPIMPNPLISICIPTYNAEKYIEETLNSILAQTYSNIELIVVNDGSTDNTCQIVRSINDNRITILSTTNGGASKARNIAYQKAQGEFIMFMDSDDLISSDFLEKQLFLIINHADCIAISSWGRFYRPDRADFKLFHELLPEPHDFEGWITSYWYQNKHNTPPGRLLIPRKIIERAGLWNEDLTLNDDFEFFTRIAYCATKLIPNPDSLYYYRSGIGGLSSANDEKAYLSLLKSFELSFNLVLSKFGQNQLVKKACANLWQSFIFETYPLLKKERLFARKKIDQLGGSNLHYPAGGRTAILIKILGWKMTKSLKLYLKK